MKNKYNLGKIVFFSFLFLLYFVYTIYGILIITNDYSSVVCQHLWVYVLLSLLIPLALLLVQACACPFLFTDFKNISFFFFFMVIFGGISVFSCIENSSLWIFALVTFILQIFITMFPIIMKFYVFLCSLKTPCCSYGSIVVKEIEITEISNENKNIIV